MLSRLPAYTFVLFRLPQESIAYRDMREKGICFAHTRQDESWSQEPTHLRIISNSWVCVWSKKFSWSNTKRTGKKFPKCFSWWNSVEVSLQNPSFSRSASSESIDEATPNCVTVSPLPALVRQQIFLSPFSTALLDRQWWSTFDQTILEHPFVSSGIEKLLQQSNTLPILLSFYVHVFTELKLFQCGLHNLTLNCANRSEILIFLVDLQTSASCSTRFSCTDGMNRNS